MRPLSFSIEARDGKARAGLLTTPHGTIQTPAFVPVGTKADVKGILPAQLQTLGVQVVLANTYHLYLQPGEGVVKEAGGLGSFMNWTHAPTISDSGGFQVFSLGAAFGRVVSKFSKEALPPRLNLGGDAVEAPTVYDSELASQHGQLAIIDDEGVTFTSHLDGSLHRFTPERSVEIQHALGADIFFAFDECTSPQEAYDYQKEAMYRTHRWADRSLKAHRQNLNANNRQALYGIGQGGQFPDLRRESTRAIAEMDFDGFGLGGSFSTAYGDSMLPLALEMLEELPESMPRHGLGIGEPKDLLEAIAAGVDTFDCVAPTRLGRHGTIYTRRGPIHLKNEKYRADFTSLSADSLPALEGNSGTRQLRDSSARVSTYDVDNLNSHHAYDVAGHGSVAGGFTRAYVAHLLRSGEMLGQILASMHNLEFIIKLVDGAREAIQAGRFETYRADFVRDYYN